MCDFCGEHFFSPDKKGYILTSFISEMVSEDMEGKISEKRGYIIKNIIQSIVSLFVCHHIVWSKYSDPSFLADSFQIENTV